MAETKNMTAGKPVKLLVGFALPIMVGNAFQLLYSVADSAVVGRLLGVTAFAAVGGTGFYYWLAFSVTLGLTQGFGTLLAQRFGADDLPGFRKTIAMALLLACALGATLSCAFALVAKPVLVMLNTPSDIIDDAALYLHIILGAGVVTFVYNTSAAVLRAAGDSKTPLYAMIFASGINIVLDIAFVLAVPTIAAVAVATVIAQVFACGFCLRAIMKTDVLRLTRRDWAVDTDSMKALLGLGGPIAFRDFVIALGSLPVQYVINGYGAVFVAGVAAPKKLYGFLNIIGDGMEGAAAVFVAQNFGAGLFDRIKSGVRTAAGVMLAGSAVIAVGLFIFGRGILGFMLTGNDAAAAIDIAVGQLNVMAVCLPTLYLLCLYRAVIQGMGNSVVPMAAGFVELALRIAAALVLPGYIGARGVYFVEVAGWPVCAVMLYIAYHAVYRRKSGQAKLRGGA